MTCEKCRHEFCWICSVQWRYPKLCNCDQFGADQRTLADNLANIENQLKLTSKYSYQYNTLIQQKHALEQQIARMEQQRSRVEQQRTGTKPKVQSSSSSSSSSDSDESSNDDPREEIFERIRRQAEEQRRERERLERERLERERLERERIARERLNNQSFNNNFDRPENSTITRNWIIGICSAGFVSFVGYKIYTVWQQKRTLSHLVDTAEQMVNNILAIELENNNIYPLQDQFDMNAIMETITSNDKRNMLYAAIKRYDVVLQEAYAIVTSSKYAYQTSAYFIKNEQQLINKLQASFNSLKDIVMSCKADIKWI